MIMNMWVSIGIYRFMTGCACLWESMVVYESLWINRNM